MRYHVALTVVVGFVVAACNGENRAIPYSRPAGTLPSKTEPLRGTLPASLGTVGAKEFQAAIDKVAIWDGGHEADRCTDFFCFGSSSKVPVAVEPAFDAANADFGNVTTHGTILIRITNRGGKKTNWWARYKLEPGKTYYVVVSGDGKAGHWFLVPFALNQKENPKSEAGGDFKDCDHYDQPKTSKAAFWSCKDAKKHADDPLSAMKTASISGFGFLATFTHFAAFQIGALEQAPGWVTCAYGCCTLE